MKNEKKTKVELNKTEKGFDINHKNLLPQLPSQLVNAPKEATDPAELIKHS